MAPNGGNDIVGLYAVHDHTPTGLWVGILWVLHLGRAKGADVAYPYDGKFDRAGSGCFWLAALKQI